MPFLYPWLPRSRVEHRRRLHTDRNTLSQENELIQNNSFTQTKDVRNGQGRHRTRKDKRLLWKPSSEEAQASLKQLSAFIASKADATTDSQPEHVDGDSSVEHAKIAKDVNTEKSGSKLESVPPSPTELSTEYTPKRRKEEQDHDPLKSNPWAQMLASPLRQCMASRTRLPQDLMVDFGMVEHPTSQQPFIVPDGLGDLQGLLNEMTPKQDRRKTGHEGVDLKGRSVRLTASPLLMNVMSNQVTYHDTRDHTRKTRKRAVVLSIAPTRWKDIPPTAQSFQRASKGADFPASIGSQTTDSMPADLEQLQWQSDIQDRMLNIMRLRVLLAFDRVGLGNWHAKKISNRTISCHTSIESACASVLDNSQTLDHNNEITEFWNDMGDIERPGAVSNKTNVSEQPEKPPIAVGPMDLDQNITAPQPHEPSTSSEVGYGGVLLHLGTFRKYCELREGCRDGSGQAPTNTYLPPMISFTDEQHLPVFNLASMLGSDLLSLLSGVIAARKIYQKEFWNSIGDTTSLTESECASAMSTTLEGLSEANPMHNEEQYILMRSTATGYVKFMDELWQLWRYLDGWNGLEDGDSGEHEQITSTLSEESRLRMRKELESCLFLDV